MFTPAILILLASAGLIDGRSVFEARHVDTRHLHNLIHKRTTENLLEARELVGLVHQRQNSDATATTLAANAIQSGSFVDGSQEVGANELNQAKSLTSQNNFINNCAGKTLTNGLQITTGSCNGITMGDIPAKTAMVSSIITFPLAGSATIESDTTFNITVQMSNIVAGSFTNPDATYYAAPQQLSGGLVIGHTHVTVQDMGASLNPTTPLDATQFAFFKGINNAGNGKGLLSATVTGGLPAGNYRVCTLASASNHQPVLMPVAQRGTADDCTKFTVIGSGTTANAASNDGSGGLAAAALAASAVAAGPGAVVDSSSTASSVDSSSTSSSEASTTKAGKDTNKSSSSVETTEASKSTSTKDSGRDTTTTSSSSVETTNASKSTSTKDSGKDTTTTSSSSAETTNASKSTTTKDSGNNAKAIGSSSLFFANTTSVVSTTNAGNGADVATTTTSSSKGKKTDVVKKVVVIETFFDFSLALGGLCPSVSKNGNQFKILEELFDDLGSAAAAACGVQFTACVSLAGAGFSLEECATQKDSCGSAASSATTASSVTQVTGTAIVAVSATVTGSVISQTTISTIIPISSSVPASTTSDASLSATQAVAVVQTTAAATLAGVSESTCALVTSTVYVDEPATTEAADVVSCSSLPTVTLTVQPLNVDVAAASGTASAASTIQTASASALGGIAAPAISNSGDPTRPFLVNGNTFVNKAAAVQRSCDIQFNACANAFNSGAAAGAFNIADCQTQEDDCITASS